MFERFTFVAICLYGTIFAEIDFYVYIYIYLHIKIKSVLLLLDVCSFLLVISILLNISHFRYERAGHGYTFIVQGSFP